MKIDADQIYFKDKLLEIREALLSDINASKTLMKLLKIDKISWYIPMKKLRNSFRTYYVKKLFNIKNKDYKFNGAEELLNLKDFIIYSRIKHKEDFSIDLAGFNLYLYNGLLYLNHMDLFNGSYGDHFILAAKKNNVYYMCDESGFENIHTSYNRCISGFAWVHLGNIKKRNCENICGILKINDINNMFWKDINIYLTDNYNNIKKDFGDKYFDIDKKYLTKEFYDRYLKKPLEYAIKNSDKFANYNW